MDNNIVMQNKFLVSGAVATALVLAVVATQFTDEWTWFDFAAATVLLLGAAGAFGLVASGFRKTKHKALVGVSVLAVLSILWVELAVGLVGSPLAGS